MGGGGIGTGERAVISAAAVAVAIAGGGDVPAVVSEEELIAPWATTRTSAAPATATPRPMNRPLFDFFSDAGSSRLSSALRGARMTGATRWGGGAGERRRHERRGGDGRRTRRRCVRGTMRIDLSRGDAPVDDDRHLRLVRLHAMRWRVRRDNPRIASVGARRLDLPGERVDLRGTESPVPLRERRLVELPGGLERRREPLCLLR